MSTSSKQPLRQSLEQLYHVFAVYPFRPTMPCCIPHCFEQKEIDALNQPLHLLGKADLDSFTWSLLLTCGDTEDFKHFLPRLFELASDDSPGYFCDTEIVVGKLAHAEFETWPTAERSVVLDFLRVWWRVEIERDADSFAIGDLLTGLCCAKLDLQEFFAMWLANKTPGAASNLAQFVMDKAVAIRMGKTFNAFLEKNYLPVINAWLFSDEVLTYLEEGFFNYADTPQAETLSSAVDVLTSLRHVSI